MQSEPYQSNNRSNYLSQKNSYIDPQKNYLSCQEINERLLNKQKLSEKIFPVSSSMSKNPSAKINLKSKKFKSQPSEPIPTPKKKPRRPTTLINKFQLNLANFIKGHKENVILKGTKRFTDKSGDYYLKNILIQKNNQNNPKFTRRLSLTNPTNLYLSITKCQGIKPIYERTDKIETVLPDGSLTPIPEIDRKKIKTKNEKKELSNAERTAVHIRRLEYSTEIQKKNNLRRNRELYAHSRGNNPNNPYNNYNIDSDIIEKIIIIQQWWKLLYRIIFIQKCFRGYLSRKKSSALIENQIKELKLIYLNELVRKFAFKKFMKKLKRQTLLNDKLGKLVAKHNDMKLNNLLYDKFNDWKNKAQHMKELELFMKDKLTYFNYLINKYIHRVFLIRFLNYLRQKIIMENMLRNQKNYNNKLLSKYLKRWKDKNNKKKIFNSFLKKLRQNQKIKNNKLLSKYFKRWKDKSDKKNIFNSFLKKLRQNQKIKNNKLLSKYFKRWKDKNDKKNIFNAFLKKLRDIERKKLYPKNIYSFQIQGERNSTIEFEFHQIRDDLGYTNIYKYKHMPLSIQKNNEFTFNKIDKSKDYEIDKIDSNNINILSENPNKNTKNLSDKISKPYVKKITPIMTIDDTNNLIDNNNNNLNKRLKAIKKINIKNQIFKPCIKININVPLLKDYFDYWNNKSNKDKILKSLHDKLEEKKRLKDLMHQNDLKNLKNNLDKWKKINDDNKNSNEIVKILKKKRIYVKKGKKLYDLSNYLNLIKCFKKWKEINEKLKDLEEKERLKKEEEEKRNQLIKQKLGKLIKNHDNKLLSQAFNKWKDNIEDDYKYNGNIFLDAPLTFTPQNINQNPLNEDDINKFNSTIKNAVVKRPYNTLKNYNNNNILNDKAFTFGCKSERHSSKKNSKFGDDDDILNKLNNYFSFKDNLMNNSDIERAGYYTYPHRYLIKNLLRPVDDDKNYETFHKYPKYKVKYLPKLKIKNLHFISYTNLYKSGKIVNIFNATPMSSIILNNNEKIDNNKSLNLYDLISNNNLNDINNNNREMNSSSLDDVDKVSENSDATSHYSTRSGVKLVQENKDSVNPINYKSQTFALDDLTDLNKLKTLTENNNINSISNFNTMTLNRSNSPFTKKGNLNSSNLMNESNEYISPEKMFDSNCKDGNENKAMKIKGNFYDMIASNKHNPSGKNQRIQVINCSCPIEKIVEENKKENKKYASQKLLRGLNTEKNLIQDVIDLCEKDLHGEPQVHYNPIEKKSKLSFQDPIFKDNFSVVIPMPKNDSVTSTDCADNSNINKVILIQDSNNNNNNANNTLLNSNNKNKNNSTINTSMNENNYSPYGTIGNSAMREHSSNHRVYTYNNLQSSNTNKKTPQICIKFPNKNNQKYNDKTLNTDLDKFNPNNSTYRTNNNNNSNMNYSSCNNIVPNNLFPNSQFKLKEMNTTVYYKSKNATLNDSEQSDRKAYFNSCRNNFANNNRNGLSKNKNNQQASDDFISNTLYNDNKNRNYHNSCKNILNKNNLNSNLNESCISQITKFDPYASTDNLKFSSITMDIDFRNATQSKIVFNNDLQNKLKRFYNLIKLTNATKLIAAYAERFKSFIMISVLLSRTRKINLINRLFLVANIIIRWKHMVFNKNGNLHKMTMTNKSYLRYKNASSKKVKFNEYNKVFDDNNTNFYVGMPGSCNNLAFGQIVDSSDNNNIKNNNNKYSTKTLNAMNPNLLSQQTRANPLAKTLRYPDFELLKRLKK